MSSRPSVESKAPFTVGITYHGQAAVQIFQRTIS